MKPIKFGTDGWRAIIAEEFTEQNLARVSAATGRWAKRLVERPKIVVGYDCRFGGERFARIVAEVLAHEGCHVVLSTKYVSTPVVSLATVRLGCTCGIIITASHNPPDYSGFKIKGSYGGPALPEMVSEVEAMIPDSYTTDLPAIVEQIAAGLIQMVDIEKIYVDHARENFDLDAIRRSGIKIGYDAMYGAGQDVMRQLLPDITFLHAEFNPSFGGTPPEPILKNLLEFSELIKAKGLEFGLATDGDADRIGMLDADGKFVDSHHIILMLIDYLVQVKGKSGKVVNSFSCTSKIGQRSNQLGMENIVTAIGFKYLCGEMLKGNVLIAGEESGGIAVDGHLPERDGVWIGLTILEYMAKTGKSLKDLISSVYESVGTFAMERYDLHVEDGLKKDIVAKAKANGYSHFGKYQVTGTESVDGYKFQLHSGEWVMLRASGTEPLLRIYAEAKSHTSAIAILDATQAELGL